MSSTFLSTQVRISGLEARGSDPFAGPHPKPHRQMGGGISRSSDNPARSAPLTQMSQAHPGPVTKVQLDNPLDETKVPSHIFFLGTSGNGDALTLNDIDELSHKMQLSIETSMAESVPSLAHQLGAKSEYSEMFQSMGFKQLDLKSMKKPPLILIDPFLYVGKDSKTMGYHGKDVIDMLNDLVRDLKLTPEQAPRIMLVRSFSTNGEELKSLKDRYPYIVPSSYCDPDSTYSMYAEQGLIVVEDKDLMKILHNYQKSL